MLIPDNICWLFQGLTDLEFGICSICGYQFWSWIWCVRSCRLGKVMLLFRKKQKRKFFSFCTEIIIDGWVKEFVFSFIRAIKKKVYLCKILTDVFNNNIKYLLLNRILLSKIVIVFLLLGLIVIFELCTA